MNYTLTLTVIFSFILITVFGFLSMSHGDGHEHLGCVAALSSGADCPQDKTDFFSFAFFHISAFKNFSSAIFAENFLAAFTLFSWFLFVAWRVFGMGFGSAFYEPGSAFQRLRFESISGRLPEQKFISWLSLHEASPTLF